MDNIPYGKQFIDEDDINSVIEILKSDFITQGNTIQKFENKLTQYCNCKYAIVFSSGTAALHGAYFASGIQHGDEFITSPNTFVASANGGLYMEAVPVLADIEMDNYNINIDEIEKKITSKTRVITPVSYAGNPFNMKKLKAIIEGKNIILIHDAAHAIGSKIENADICEYADMTIVSFHPVKHITTGEGGAVLTNNKNFYNKLLKFRTHGITKNADELINNDGLWYYEMQELGFNYRITDIQCALGISQLDKLNASIKKRNEIALIYNNEFKNLDWITTPKNNFNMDWIFDKNVKPKSIHSYHLYPILVDNKIDRSKFFNYLRKNNIFVQVHYIPINYMPYYQKNYGFKKGDMINAENFYNREISLPMFPTLKSIEQEYVINKIKEYNDFI